MKKFSINLLEEQAEYLDFVAGEVGKTRGELVREVLEREIAKYITVFGKPLNAKYDREPQK